MASFPKICPKCRERSLNLAVEEFSEVVEHDGREYRITIPDLLS